MRLDNGSGLPNESGSIGSHPAANPSTAWLYAFMSRAQAEQSSELAQLRREMTELHRQVLSCQLEKAEARIAQGRR